MRTQGIASTLFGIALVGCGMAPAQSHVSDATTDQPLASLVQGTNGFAVRLYKAIGAQKKGDNVFLSPASISTALAMTYNGAEGNTASEMSATLGFLPSKDDNNQAFEALLGKVRLTKDRDGEQLSFANRLWGQEGFNFLPGFIDSTKKHFGAGLVSLDFKNATEASRGTINQWVAEQTNDKIKDLIPQGALKPDARLVLTNAVYFLAPWQHKFRTELTKEGVFHATPTQDRKVSMMSLTESLRHVTDENATVDVVELPYAGQHEGQRGKTSMVLFVPREIDGLAKVEDKLTPEKLTLLLAALDQAPLSSSTKVNLKLPKFKVTGQFDLGDTLKTLGMAKAFDQDKANFSGINGREDSQRNPLYISKVLHKTYIEVEERGTEAAGATAVIIAVATSISAPPRIVNVTADRPFAYLIRDNETGTILFMGRLANPT